MTMTLDRLTRPQLSGRITALERCLCDLELQASMTGGPAYQCMGSLERERQALIDERAARDRAAQTAETLKEYRAALRAAPVRPHTDLVGLAEALAFGPATVGRE